MVANGLKIVGLLALAIPLLGIAGFCHGNTPSVTDIEIVPHEVVVGSHPTSPTTFQLEARLWTGPETDRRTAVESQHYGTLVWTVDQPWLTIAGTTAPRATFSINAGAAPAETAEVTLKAGGKTTKATISVAPAVVTGQDMLTANYIADKAPDAVVVNGVPAGIAGACNVSLSAFVRRSMLGNVEFPCAGDRSGWEAAVLAADHQLVFAPAGWTPADNPVDAGSHQGSLRALPVALRVMVGDGSLGPIALTKLQGDVLTVADGEIKAANSILAETRAGIELTVQDTKTIPVSDAVEIGECGEGDNLTSTYDTGGLLNVYYVNGLHGLRGRACAWHDKRPQDVIYVGWNQHSPTTFIHELGHALGLTLPGQGHSDIVAGFDVTNVMTSGDNDSDPGGRRRFSAGQVFRMNADSASWLNRALDAANNPLRETAAPRLDCQCGDRDPAGRCPPMVADVAKPSKAPSTAWPWDCFDQLRLTKVSDADDEHPVAIVAGRRWRAPPGTCSTDLRGQTEKHWLATYVRFHNLTHPADCPFWAAIFFSRHRLLYLELPEAAFTQAADQLPVTDPMPASVVVDVRVHYPASQQSTVNQDLDHASKTFGESNRSGIVLAFDRRPNAPCPQTTPGALEIVLCYAPGGNQEATLVLPRRIEVRFGGRTESTVSHFLGQALGLKTLGINQAGFPDNIMHINPVDRGQELTLGQVFRIHVPLSTSLPGCDPGPCPSLAADVAP